MLGYKELKARARLPKQKFRKFFIPYILKAL